MGETFPGYPTEHWRAENTLHWCLDLTLDEDRSRVREPTGAQNLTLVRKLALRWLKKEPAQSRIRVKRKMIA